MYIGCAYVYNGCVNMVMKVYRPGKTKSLWLSMKSSEEAARADSTAHGILKENTLKIQVQCEGVSSQCETFHFSVYIFRYTECINSTYPAFTALRPPRLRNKPPHPPIAPQRRGPKIGPADQDEAGTTVPV